MTDFTILEVTGKPLKTLERRSKTIIFVVSEEPSGGSMREQWLGGRREELARTADLETVVEAVTGPFPPLPLVIEPPEAEQSIGPPN